MSTVPTLMLDPSENSHRDLQLPRNNPRPLVPQHVVRSISGLLLAGLCGVVATLSYREGDYFPAAFSALLAAILVWASAVMLFDTPVRCDWKDESPLPKPDAKSTVKFRPRSVPRKKAPLLW